MLSNEHFRSLANAALLLSLGCFLLGMSFDTSALAAAPGDQAEVKAPLVFEPNRGQTRSPAKYVGRGSGFVLYVNERGTLLSFDLPSVGETTERGLSFELVDGSGKSQLVALDQVAGTSTYMYGSDRANWITGLPNFSRVQFRNAFPGVQVNLKSAPEGVEYDFVVDPGTPAAVIDLRIAGADQVRLRSSGDLSIETRQANLQLRKPTAYQQIDGEKRFVSARYLVRGRHVGFVLGPYDHSRSLVIDPVLTIVAATGDKF